MHDPFTGKNCSGFRFRFHVRSLSNLSFYLPIEMKELPQIKQLLQGESPLSVFHCHSKRYAMCALSEIRRRYDFDYWAATEYFIQDINDPDRIVPLILNESQLHVVDIMRKRYTLRQMGRYVISKAQRRCGLTTCIQAYILWMQTFQRSNNSYTCGPNDLHINPLKSNLCRFLKKDFTSFQSGIFLDHIRWFAYFNTFLSPDAIRGRNIGFVHLADMSRWKDPSSKKTRRAYTAAISGVLLEYFTLVLLEGDLPKRKSFDVKRFLREYPQESNPFRIKRLSKAFKNPFFLNEILVADSFPDPYFFHIHIPNPIP